MSNQIKGRVVKILNEREIAIDVGTDHGVSDGMFFDVLEPRQSIYDSFTKTELGSLQRPKVRVRINHVQERFAVAATFRSRRVNRGGLDQIGAWASLLLPTDWVEQHETLRAKEHKHGLWNELDEADSLVKRGDPVVQVMAEREGSSEEVEQDQSVDQQDHSAE